MIAVMTLQLGLWSFICLVLAILLVLSTKSVIPAIILFVVWLIGLFIGSIFRLIIKLTIFIFNFIYSHPIISAVIFGIGVLIFLAYRLISYLKDKRRSK
jgi:hypothetical protein